MADQSGLSDTFYGRWAGLYDLFATAPWIRDWRDRAVADLEHLHDSSPTEDYDDLLE